MLWAVLAGGTIGAGPANAAEAPAAKKAPGPTLPAISVVAAVTGAITERILASGTVEPAEQVFVQPQIEAQAIETLEVEVGALVKEGDVLARLSSASLILLKSQLSASRAAAEAGIAQSEAQMAEAQAGADEALRVRDRVKTLASEGISAKASVDQAQASSDSAKARVASAMQGRKSAEAQLKVVDAQIADVDLKLARTEIRAPVSGMVAERNVMIGAIASAAGKPMFVLVRDGLLELWAEVAEQDVLRLKPGQQASLKVAGMKEVLTGKVRMVEPVVSPETRLGRVRILIDNAADVRWGVFIDAEIISQQKTAILLPISAVGISTAGATALKVVDGKVVEIAIVTGIREGNLIEVMSGIDNGDLVVAKAGAFVRDGDRINPVLIEPVANVSN